MPSIDEIADEYVTRAAALDPYLATSAGIGGHDDELPDLRQDGFAGRAGPPHDRGPPQPAGG